MLKKTLLGLAIVAGTAFGAEAGSVYASGYQDIVGGSPDATRADPTNALGAADGLFYELGRGGEIVLTFGTLFTSPGKVWEVTYGSTVQHHESVDLYGSLDGTNYVSIGSIDNTTAKGGGVFTFTGKFNYLKFADTTTFAGSNGFDIDSVSVAAVPVPAAGLLLGGALAGFAALRRRASKA